MDEQERARKLRLVESAAASAVLNGCDPDEVRRRVEVGIADALDIDARRSRPAAAPARPVEAQGGALSAWSAAVNG